MNGTAMVAAHLDEQIDAIIASWRDAVRRGGDVPQEASLTHQEFVDHIPALIDEMAVSAARRVVEYRRGRARITAGCAGGKVTTSREVVTELGYLRTVLMQSTFRFARDHQFDLDALEAAHEAFNEVLNEADDERDQSVSGGKQGRDRLGARPGRRSPQGRGRRATDRRGRTDQAPDRSGKPADRRLGHGSRRPDGERQPRRRTSARLSRVEARRRTADRRPATITIRSNVPTARRTATRNFPLLRALRGESVVQEEFNWKQPAITRNVLASAAPLTKPDGSIIGAVVVIQDMTERKQLEARLAASEARFRGIAERSPALIWRADADGRHDFFNQSWLDFRGRPLDLEMGDGWIEGVHPDDRERCRTFYQNVFQRREPFEMLYRLQRWDGQFRWIIDRGHAVFRRGEPVPRATSAVCLDITERIDLEAALERQRELAEESSLHKTRLVSALSHDARTPLNAVVLVRAAARNPHRRPRRRTSRCRSACARSATRSRNLLDLLGDLLDLSKLDAGATARRDLPLPARAGPRRKCLARSRRQARQKGLDHALDAGPLGGQPSRPTGRSSSRSSATCSPTPCGTPSGATSGCSATGRTPDPRSASRTRVPASPPRTRTRIFEEFAGSTTAAASPARGPAWAWRSADGWPTCSAARSACPARPGEAAPSPWSCPPDDPDDARPRPTRRGPRSAAEAAPPPGDDPRRRGPRRQPPTPGRRPPPHGLSASSKPTTAATPST